MSIEILASNWDSTRRVTHCMHRRRDGKYYVVPRWEERHHQKRSVIVFWLSQSIIVSS